MSFHYLYNSEPLYYSAPQYSIGAKERYLAAVAQAKAAEAAAKAAEAEYLSAQAISREEEALKARLYELQQRKRLEGSALHGHNGLSFVPYPPTPAEFPPSYSCGANQNFSDGFVPVRTNEVEQLQARLREERATRILLERQLEMKAGELCAFRAPVKQKLAVFEEDVSTPSIHAQTKQTARQAATPKNFDSRAVVPELQAVQQFLKALFGQSVQVVNKESLKKPLSLATIFTQPTSSKEEAIASKSTPVEASLVEQLKARYEKEGTDEIRDTIQAIFNSLSENPAPEPSVATKGKSKDSGSVSRTGKAEGLLSRDVLNSLERVQNIEAAFQSLAADFVFPSQLDFTSATAAGTSERTAISRLAFTSRNHPVRFYEQTLSALLIQLDLIDSHGDETLRGKRKEVVDFVEKALENLETEIAGRWNAKLAKDKKDACNVESKLSTPQQVLEASQDTKLTEETSAILIFPVVNIPAYDAKSELPPTAENIVQEASVLQQSGVATREKDTSLDSQLVAPASLSDADVAEQREATLVYTEEGLPKSASDNGNPLLQMSEDDATTLEYLDAREASGFNDNPEATYPTTNRVVVPYEVRIEDSKDRERDDGNDTYLLSRLTDPTDVKSKEAQMGRIVVEDLGSDWSDVDA